MHWPGSIGGGSGTQLGGAIGGDTGSWWSLDDGPDSWRPRPAALRDRRIISLRRSLVTTQKKKKIGHAMKLRSTMLPVFFILLWNRFTEIGYKKIPFLGSLVSSEWHFEFLHRLFFLIYSIISYLPSATGGASPVPRTVAWNHRDGIGNCLHSR